VADRGLLAEVSDEDRQALLIAAGRASRPDTYQQRRLLKAFRRARKQVEEAVDREVRAGTGIRSARRAPVYVPPPQLEAGALPDPAPPTAPAAAARPEHRPDGPELKKPKTCYVCKAEFRRLHFFYDALCSECAEFNYRKRFETASLEGRVALITGGRVKIGYQAALRMLRVGARVIVTTRFPHDAALRYSREPDFTTFRNRLHVHGLDLRHSPSVEIFCRFVEHAYDRLDILINNAAQTVRRPPGFYAHLLETEARPAPELPPEVRPLLRLHDECTAALGGGAARRGIEAPPDATGLATWHEADGGLGLVASARLSQVRYAYDDATRRPDVFPDGRTDADLQQVDLRDRNTWRLTLSEVPTPEMLEVHLVNAVAPFILCGRLKPLMMRDRTDEKHVVNVSAMEGIFSRGTKTDKHPHTNMAKAALNMMTLTSARGYVQDGIHMNAVDTGWVTDEDPFLHATRKKEELDFEPPLDIVDGVARICDPFFSGLLTGVHVWGKFLKDYKPGSW